MNIDELTIGQVKELAALLNTCTAKLQTENVFEIGQPYLIRTVTMIDTGRVVAVTDQFVILEEAAWIADTGLFSDALKRCEFNEVEPFPDGRVGVGIGSIIDFIRIPDTQRSKK